MMECADLLLSVHGVHVPVLIDAASGCNRSAAMNKGSTTTRNTATTTMLNQAQH